MSKRTFLGSGILVAFGLVVAITTSVLAQSTTHGMGPAIDPAAVQKKAGTPPPANAKKANSIGKSAVKLSTANSSGDDDSFWIDAIDIDGDGDVDDANLVWDDEDGVLFAYEDGVFTCASGGTGSGELLIGVNAAGNARNRPAGSGFWLADLDEDECAAEADGLWGCRFDANGDETACGVATLDEDNDDLVIVAMQN
jgi:hypothetical protein